MQPAVLARPWTVRAQPRTVVFAPLERWWIALFGVFTAAFFAIVGPLAAAKPFWHDEIYTILTADLPSLGTIWRAAHDGIDLSPPLNAMLTHLVDVLAGTGRVTTRIPALVGFWTMLLVVFELVRKRSHVMAALSAAALPCLTEAFRYATEARGYGLMLGLFAVALWSWSEAARGHHRRLQLPLMALALAAGLWNQYFAVLAFVPIGVGEAIRIVRARRIDWAVAIWCAVALASALPLRGLMQLAAAYGSTYWRHAQVNDIGPSYALLFGSLLGGSLAIAFGLVIVLVLASVALGVRSPITSAYQDLPAHEIGAGVATLFVPAVAVLLGVFGTGVFVPRYALGGVIGLSIVLPLAVARIGSRGGIADVVLCTALVSTFWASAFRSIVTEGHSYRDPVAMRPIILQQLEKGDTVVVSGTTEYLQLWYYAPPELRWRLVYLADPAASLAVTGTDTVDRNYIALGRWSALSVVDFGTFVADNPTFVMYAFSGGWLMDRLRADGAAFQEIGRELNVPIYRVTPATSRRISRSD